MASMKFNDKEISAFASASTSGIASPVDREGYLLKRGEREREGYKQRWFILKGNLLFYYRSHLTLQEPLGLIVLERVSVAHSEKTSVSFGFKMEFDGSGTRVYYLSAPSSEARRSWMESLKHASYEHMRGTLMSLQARLKELTGRDPLKEALSACTTPQVPSLESESAASKFHRTKTLSVHRSRLAVKHAASAASKPPGAASGSTLGVEHLGLPSQTPSHLTPPSEATAAAPLQMELSLACQNLPPCTSVASPKTAPRQQRNVFVEISLRRAGADHRTPAEAIGKTEVIHGSLSPQFLTITTVPLHAQAADKAACAAEASGTVEFRIYDQELAAEEEEEEEAAVAAAAEAEAAVEQNGVPAAAAEGDTGEAGGDTSRREPGATAVHEEPASTLIGIVVCPVRELQHADEFSSAIVSLEIVEPNTRVPSGTLVVEATTMTSKAEEESSDEEGGFVVLRANRSASNPAGTAPQPASEAAGPGRIAGGASLRIKSEHPTGQRAPARSRQSTLIRAESNKQTYCFSARNQHRLRVTETMTEGAYTFTVPSQLLKLLLLQDQQTIRELEALGTLLGPVETARRRRYQECLSRVQLYQEHRAFLDTYQEHTFKPSRLKKNKDLALVTTNLHVQSIKVIAERGGDKSDPRSYDVITLGCPAAHVCGFKHGGLRTLLAARDKAIHEVLGERAHALGNRQQIARCLGRLRGMRSRLKQGQAAVAAVLAGHPTVAEVLGVYKDLDRPLQQLLDLLQTSVVAHAMEQATPSRPARSSFDGESESHLTQYDLVETITSSYDTLRDDIKSYVVDLGQDLALLDGLRGAQNMFDVAVETAFLEVCECLHIRDLQSDAVLLQLHHPQPDLVHRRDIAFSQALAALVTVFVANFKRQINNPKYLLQIAEIGYCVHLSSLLSTAGDEEGMLEDCIQAMSDLQVVRIVFAEVHGGVIDPVLSGRRDCVILELGVSRSMMEKLPPRLQDGGEVRVFPIVFSQGINEKQSVANRFGDTMLQDRINNENFANLQKLVHNFKMFHQNHFPHDAATPIAIDRLWVAFDQAVRSKKSKNVEILTISEDLSRLMNTGRLTCCKSGKDRTSMAVTLEQCTILRTQHGMIDSLLQQALDAMRTSGTRRENVYKNSNEPRYAFNKLQVYTLPKLYRPPPNTFGSTVT